jgi:hypothetical protein
MGNTALARNKRTLSLGEIRVSDKKEGFSERKLLEN